MSSSDDGGYVHDPSNFDESGGVDEDGRRSSDDDWGADGDPVEQPVHPAEADREFGWRGWVLVGVIVFAFVICPVAIVLWPPGVNYFVALLILPLLPAVLLAATAVWATTRP